jgi:hypothetical protein
MGRCDLYAALVFYDDDDWNDTRHDRNDVYSLQNSS